MKTKHYLCLWTPMAAILTLAVLFVGCETAVAPHIQRVGGENVPIPKDGITYTKVASAPTGGSAALSGTAYNIHVAGTLITIGDGTNSATYTTSDTDGPLLVALVGALEKTDTFTFNSSGKISAITQGATDTNAVTLSAGAALAGAFDMALTLTAGATNGFVFTDTDDSAITVTLGASPVSSMVNDVMVTPVTTAPVLTFTGNGTTLSLATAATTMVAVGGSTVTTLTLTGTAPTVPVTVTTTGLTINVGALSGVIVDAMEDTTVDISGLATGGGDTVRLMANGGPITFTLTLGAPGTAWAATTAPGETGIEDTAVPGTTKYTVAGTSTASTAINTPTATGINVNVSSGETWTVTVN